MLHTGSPAPWDRASNQVVSTGAGAASSGSTNTCTEPPHISPTSHDMSGAYPYSMIWGRPVRNTSTACSTTSVSTHPPLIDPTILPPAVIAILAPAGRGVEPTVVSTVAITTCSPAACQARIWSTTSRINPSLSSGSRGTKDPSSVIQHTATAQLWASIRHLAGPDDDVDG